MPDVGRDKFKQPDVSKNRVASFARIFTEISYDLSSFRSAFDFHREEQRHETIGSLSNASSLISLSNSSDTRKGEKMSMGKAKRRNKAFVFFSSFLDRRYRRRNDRSLTKKENFVRSILSFLTDKCR